MNKRTIIIIALLISFLALGLYFFDSTKIEYATISQARLSGGKSQIIGSFVKDSILFNKEKMELIFPFCDKDGSRAVVKYSGAAPNGFASAEQLVVKGKFIGDTLIADEILTKCPSKYENKR